jgi:hypothetical protein
MTDNRPIVPPDDSLHEFIHVMEQRLLDFQAVWEKGQAEDPETFPETMDTSDWLEQFEMFKDWPK